MRHIIKSMAWSYSTEPFPAYRATLSYGRNQKDRAFLPVSGVTPITLYRVVPDIGGAPLYEGTDQEAALAAKKRYDIKNVPMSRHYRPTASVKEAGLSLPEDQFHIIKTSKGTLLVVSGVDTTRRCLLMTGYVGGYRGNVELLREETTGQVLAKCQAGNACDSEIQIAALLAEGQSIAIHSYGRRTDDVLLSSWDGETLTEKVFPIEEWKARSPQVEEGIVL